MDITVGFTPPEGDERCEGWCAPSKPWAFNVPMVDGPNRLLCYQCANEARALGEALPCTDFDPGDVLAAYGGRRCFTCNIHEKYHPKEAL